MSKIDQKIDDFSTRVTSATGGAPTTTRSAVTEVMVKDQDTIAMGGMMRDKEEVSVSKVPLLGDIPVLGWLFKNKQKSLTKVNILYFLTPKILSPYEKTTANVTADRLQIHRDRVGQVMDKDSPNEKEYKALADKLEKQKQGPLYDTSLNFQYNKESERLRQLQEEKARQMSENKDLQMQNSMNEERKRGINEAEALKIENAKAEPIKAPEVQAAKTAPEKAEEKEIDYQEILKEVNETKK
jgi:general secretion pathway protein D